MDTQRLILFFVFSFSLFMLWTEWEKEYRPKPVASVSTPASTAAKSADAVPPPSVRTAVPGMSTASAVASTEPAIKGELVQVQTDLLDLELDTLGASINKVALRKHRETADSEKHLTLLGPEHQYAAQSGLTGEGGPNHRTLWKLLPGERRLAEGKDQFEVRMRAEGRDGLSVDKIFTLKRDSYLVDVRFELRNNGSAPIEPNAYFQLTHDGKEVTPNQVAPSAAQGFLDGIKGAIEGVARSFGAQSYLGFAAYTEEKKFQKVTFPDLDKGKGDYVKQSKDGWVSFVQHYFVSAWIPAADQAREFVVEKRPDGVYVARIVMPMAAIAPGATAQISAPLFAGPQEQNRLREAAPGFDLVVDYGWLAIIAWPLFWLLEKYHLLVGNWGVAIILLTVTIKLVFFPLSAASYKSMAKMKLVTPRLTKLREMYANDRMRMNQAMMELYKTEKINPLGGCFPVLVQIPVFIALYWVLLAAIELRHAPFMLWITDLSVRDPFFVLPLLMTASMVLQTKMNPAPPDPVQAKVMAVMPYVFSIFFFFFPAGLVLYWLVNNILSISQQWQIQRMFEQAKATPKR